MSEVTKKHLRNFGLALGIMSVIVGTRLFFKYHNNNFLYLMGIGILFMVLGLFSPASLRLVYVVFNRVASFILGWLLTRVMLILTFYLVVAPTGLFMRLIGKDLLNLKIEKNNNSYWIKRERKPTESRQYEKQF